MDAPFAPDAPRGTRRDDPLQILVVDDSQAIHLIMKKMLGDLAGHFRLETDHASSGEEALERVQTRCYDVVFLDVEMPGVGGHEACRRIKQRCDKTRVAMLSSLANLANREAAFSAGCDHYLEKPPKDQVLGAVLRVAGLRKQLQLPSMPGK